MTLTYAYNSYQEINALIMMITIFIIIEIFAIYGVFQCEYNVIVALNQSRDSRVVTR